MHVSEWLADAKAVPVGRSKRVYHGAETRPNLVVYNNEDSWSCYCHSCKTHGKVYKEYLTPVDTTLPPVGKYLQQRDLMSIQAYRKAQPLLFNRLVKLLNDKGVSLPMLAELNPVVHTQDQRLVFQFEDFAVGRDTTGLSKSKWFHYYTPTPMKSLYLQNSKISPEMKATVIVEDLFSAQKIRYCTPYSALWMGGTKLDQSAFTYILANKLHPVIMTDGDKAGWDCKRSLINQFKLYGIAHSVVNTPDGLDPKDLNKQQLNALIGEALCQEQ